MARRHPFVARARDERELQEEQEESSRKSRERAKDRGEERELRDQRPETLDQKRDCESSRKREKNSRNQRLDLWLLVLLGKQRLVGSVVESASRRESVASESILLSDSNKSMSAWQRAGKIDAEAL